MSEAERLAPFLDRLAAAGIAFDEVASPGLAPARVIRVDAGDWGRLAHEAMACACRWVAGWGEDAGEASRVWACFERQGGYLLAHAEAIGANPALASHTPFFPAADRPERHVRDMLGVAFSSHPDARRWTRHQAWKESQHPLRRAFPVSGHSTAPTAPDHQYDFLLAHGTGVYEIPVGPVHAGIIEPGHFRFQAVGETVLNLEERLGYTHKGIEKIAEGRDSEGLARLAGRVSGDSTVAHCWAACMAMEKAAAVQVPPRALRLRALMCERERVANHLGDVGAMLNDIAFSFGFYQFGRLREDWQRMSHRAFGHRFMMDCIVPGGVAADLDPRLAAQMREEAGALRTQVRTLMAIVNDLPSVADRVRGTGVLKPEYARALGCLGYVGRASSIDFDVRRDSPYPPYDRLAVKVPVHHYGDVNARARVRIEEIPVSLDLIESLLADLPDGPVHASLPHPGAGAAGLGLVEGWRGEILTFVRFGGNGRIERFFPRDPSWLNWPALELLIHDNIVPDFPVCNKSVNGSYSGHDL